MNKCEYCGMEQGHSEVCKGFEINDPARKVREPTEEEIAEARAWRHANFPGIKD
jgi:hypothetical protein